MLADMDTQVHASRALLLEAARLKDAGRPFSLPAARAKLLATDVAMRVTTDAVQVLGGAATPPTSRWSATCARRRCCRSSRGPTRSSGWSSAAHWPAASLGDSGTEGHGRMRTTRLEAFSDGVLAIIITIMVLELAGARGR